MLLLLGDFVAVNGVLLALDVGVVLVEVSRSDYIHNWANAEHQLTTSHRLAGKMCLFFSYQCRSTTFPG